MILTGWHCPVYCLNHVKTVNMYYFYTYWIYFKELIAHGVTNVVCSNLNCFMMSMSLSRSVVCENVGCKSPVTQLISSSVLFVVILFVASYFEQLPRVSMCVCSNCTILCKSANLPEHTYLFSMNYRLWRNWWYQRYNIESMLLSFG